MHRALIIILIMLLSAVPAAAQQAQAQCATLGGTFDTATGLCTFADGLTIEVEYPTGFETYPTIQNTINTFLATQQSLIVAAAATDPTPIGPYFLEISSEVVSYSDQVKSVLFTTREYTGGAHPNLYYTTFTFHLPQDKVLSLNDLFVSGSAPLSVIAPMVQDDLTAQMGDFADSAWISGGAGPTQENYQHFTLSSDHITFYFPPYQVAAYAAGPFQSDVPLSSLRASFRPPFMKG